MVAVDNRERIADALSALIEGLAPVVANTLSAAAPETTDWTELLAQKDRAQGRHGLRYSQRDVSPMLRAMTERLGTLGYPFERVLGRRGSNYASELREVRNRWAHQDEFSAAETYRALDSAELLLQLVGAGEQAARVAELKAGLLPATPTPSQVLESQGVSTPTAEASDDGRQENISEASDNHELPDQSLDLVGAGDDDIVVHITHTSLLSYAMAHNRLQVVGEIRIENDGVEQRGASVEISVITAHGELGDPKILLVDLSAGATTVLRDVDLLLDPARMLAVDEQTPGVVRVTVRRTDGTPWLKRLNPSRCFPPATGAPATET